MSDAGIVILWFSIQNNFSNFLIEYEIMAVFQV
jgi:hypothetical protein